MSEVRVETGAFWFGYVSAGGSAHFTAMEKVALLELTAAVDGDHLVIELGARTFRIPSE